MRRSKPRRTAVAPSKEAPPVLTISQNPQTSHNRPTGEQNEVPVRRQSVKKSFTPPPYRGEGPTPVYIEEEEEAGPVIINGGRTYLVHGSYLIEVRYNPTACFLSGPQFAPKIGLVSGAWVIFDTGLIRLSCFRLMVPLSQ